MNEEGHTERRGWVDEWIVHAGNGGRVCVGMDVEVYIGWENGGMHKDVGCYKGNTGWMDVSDEEVDGGIDGYALGKESMERGRKGRKDRWVCEGEIGRVPPRAGWLRAEPIP